jgi:hypothetical protein
LVSWKSCFESKVEDLAEEAFLLFASVTVVAALVTAAAVIVIVIVVAAVVTLRRRQGRWNGWPGHSRGRRGGSETGALNDLIQFSAIQPDAAALRTEVNFDSLTV